MDNIEKVNNCANILSQNFRIYLTNSIFKMLLVFIYWWEIQIFLMKTFFL
jgi:hypothetical protein